MVGGQGQAFRRPVLMTPSDGTAERAPERLGGPAVLRWPQAPIQGGLKFPTSRRRRSTMRCDPFLWQLNDGQSAPDGASLCHCLGGPAGGGLA
jgi:hypothetical protein